ncbi:MAG: hypothetical protein L6Q97_17380, partial [Thermoanaerobaculia bacterium]|nr:hypothetical protein [Thermoanaerobaculia bacterium]
EFIKDAIEEVTGYQEDKLQFEEDIQKTIQTIDQTRSAYEEALESGEKAVKKITFGVSEKYRIESGSVIGPKPNKDEKSTRTSGQEELRTYLKYAQYDMNETNEQAEHVLDLSLGGQDSLQNLWPLETGLNIPPDQMIDEETGKQVGAKGGGQGGKLITSSTFNGKYFKVEKTR